MSNLAVNENWKDADGMVVAVPNHNYIKLRLVKSNAANGKNETVIMKADDSGKTFSVIKGDTGRKYGRRAPKKIPVVYSMDAWDDYFWDKINKDWHVKGTEENETKEIQKKGGDFAGIEDPDVKDILHILLDAANKIVEEQYSVNIENIPDEDLKRGQEIISELAAKGENISVAEFNNMLMELWLCIPRVIRRMNKEKVYNKSEFKKKLEKEQELLDFLMSMLRGKGFKTFGGNILTQNNLVWESVSKDEEVMLKNKMGDKRNRYLRAWRVTNTITEDRFNKYCTEHGITEKMVLQNYSMVQEHRTGGLSLPMDSILIRQAFRYMARCLAMAFTLHLMQERVSVIHPLMVLTGNMVMLQEDIWQYLKSQPEIFMIFMRKAETVHRDMMTFMQIIRTKIAFGQAVVEEIATLILLMMKSLFIERTRQLLNI